MQRSVKTWMISTLLLSTLLTACGTTRASLPSPAAQIPVAERLRGPCQALATPTGETMPAGASDAAAARYLADHNLPAQPDAVLALMSAFARFMQGGERSYFGGREVEHARIEAQACIDRQQLVNTIDGANAANAAAARSR